MNDGSPCILLEGVQLGEAEVWRLHYPEIFLPNSFISKGWVERGMIL